MRQFVSFLRGIRGSNGCPGEGNEASSLPPHPCSRGEKILRGRGDAPRFAFSAPSFQSHSLLTMSSSHPEPPPPNQPTFKQANFSWKLSARDRLRKGVPRDAPTLLSSLRFIPRLDLYTWYMWAKSILQGERPERAVTPECILAAGALEMQEAPYVPRDAPSCEWSETPGLE